MLLQYYFVINFFPLTTCQIQPSRLEAQVKGLNLVQVRLQNLKPTILTYLTTARQQNYFYESKVSSISQKYWLESSVFPKGKITENEHKSPRMNRIFQNWISLDENCFRKSVNVVEIQIFKNFKLFFREIFRNKFLSGSEPLHELNRSNVLKNHLICGNYYNLDDNSRCKTTCHNHKSTNC